MRAYTNPRAQLIFWLTALLGLAGDLATKRWAWAALGKPEENVLRPKVIIDGYLRFITVHNNGAVAGIGAGHSTLLICVSLAAMVFLLWLFVCSDAKQWINHLALGMLVGGALGNTYDRIFNDGRVVDFIEVNLHFWPANPWPTFNLADALLCVGVALLLLTLGTRRKESPSPTTTQQGQASSSN